MRLTGPFLYVLFSALLAGVTSRLYGQWTGGLPVWPAVLPPLVMAGAAAWLAGKFVARWVGPKVCAGLCVLGAVLAFTAFGDTVRMVNDWLLLSLRIGLTYGNWHHFVFGRALLWFAPVAFLLPFLWSRNDMPRGKLTVFVGVCTGFILARLLVGRMPTIRMMDICLAGMLAAALLWLIVETKGRIARAAAIGLAILLLTGWYFGARRTPEEPLRDVNPFAPIAARDSLYTGKGTDGVTLRDGRVVRAADIDTASRTASQLIPTLLKPAPNARIAARPQIGPPVLASYDADRLKGLYDALWVELPPAWMPEEQEYFGAAALDAALEHLAEDGVLVYDMDGHALDARMVMERIGILRQRLPHVQLWMTGLNQWQLVAARKPLSANLAEISNLLDRPTVAEALLGVDIDAPMTLLACCMTADTGRLEENLVEPIAPKLRRGEAGIARKLLFDGMGSQRLVRAFAPYYDAEMPWVAVPDEIASELRQVLAALRNARLLAMDGNPREAAKTLSGDPYLLGLADRETANARAWERLAEHGKALAAYASAFALARPRLADVLAAAAIAQTSGEPARAVPFYRLAGELAPDSLGYLMQYAAFLRECRQFAEAEKVARRVLDLVRTPSDVARARFFVAVCIARQPKREQEGLSMARAVAATVQTPEDRDTFIPAYGQLLIDVGRMVEGVNIKRHYQAYRELLPEAPAPERK